MYQYSDFNSVARCTQLQVQAEQRILFRFLKSTNLCTLHSRLVKNICKWLPSLYFVDEHIGTPPDLLPVWHITQMRQSHI